MGSKNDIDDDALATPSGADAEAPDDARLAARLDAAIDRALAEERVVGTVVLVARHGHVAYRRAAGLADREGNKPMRENAIFLLSSVAKPFTSMTVLRLADQGRLNLRDPVTRWLPEFRPRTADGATPTITIQHLLTHTAGLTYGFAEPSGHAYHRLGVSNGLDQPGLGLDENLRRIAAAPLSYAPGTSWKYSMAYDVLGAVVERACGQPLPQAMKAWVNDPLGMTGDTSFAVTDRSRLAVPYAYTEGCTEAHAGPRPVRMGREHIAVYKDMPVHFEPERIFDPRSYPSGGGGMAGTAADVLKLLEALRTARHGGFLKPATAAGALRAHVTPHAQAPGPRGPGWRYGWGWAVLEDPAQAGSPQSAGTVGWGGVYGHNWFIDPARGLAVLALTNTAVEGMAGLFTTYVRDAVYGHRLLG